MEVCTYAAPLISRPVQDAAHNVDKIVNKVADKFHKKFSFFNCVPAIIAYLLTKFKHKSAKGRGCTAERRIKKLRQHGLIKYN